MTCSHDYSDNRTSGKQVYIGENQHWTFEIMEYNICANQTSQYKLPQLRALNTEYIIILVSVWLAICNKYKRTNI